MTEAYAKRLPEDADTEADPHVRHEKQFTPTSLRAKAGAAQDLSVLALCPPASWGRTSKNSEILRHGMKFRAALLFGSWGPCRAARSHLLPVHRRRNIDYNLLLCMCRMRETGKRDKKHCRYNRDFHQKHLASRLIAPEWILHPSFSCLRVAHYQPHPSAVL
jgi:hypothetical protein